MYSTMAQIFLDVLYSFGNCLNCFPGSPTLKINSRNFKILRLLGEQRNVLKLTTPVNQGGFSYVYLVQDTQTSEELALKKIRCPFGAESVAQAMKEVDAYRLFARSPGIIHSVDHAIATERGGEPGSKTVYVLLPYYRRGNLQDLINANLVNHTAFPERRLMLLFLGVCKALREMHQYTGGSGGGQPVVGMERMEIGNGDEEDQGNGPKRKKSGKNKGGKRVASMAAAAGADDEDENEQQRPLMEGETPGSGDIKSYAHRDIKPGNIMIDDSGSNPILMDLGSIAPSPIPITSHSLAIATQDTAAEHSTMPYRAPELFDVRTGTVIDTKVDIWSLGCTLYACLVGKSPFEARSDETGGSLSMCVLGGDWRFPDEGIKRTGTSGGMKGKAAATADAAASGAGEVKISEPIRNVVRKCLNVEPTERPDIDELIDMVEVVIEELPQDGSL
ncbi:Serine/threonine-protein kinase ppk13 [Colletotrichum tanaceti]|uniref:non-specific serine/threonine protein kinase n=1 Tax=Colletotrichum tanaceti TaxID=1306861 RepID=A0A4U6XP54_9PEZI|nr:Serine/threonine-protein kinase ppk13 [Colletotrichum tanaceti]TKW57560.1 Serine/threonine-protein kinase ppk13 [Colletotrichum tanaceti]